MDINNYKYSDEGDDIYMKYFSETACSDWSFDNFQESFFQENGKQAGKNRLKAAFKNLLDNILNNKNTPEEVKRKIRSLEPKPSQLSIDNSVYINIQNVNDSFNGFSTEPGDSEYYPSKRQDYLVSINQDDKINLEESDTKWVLSSDFNFSNEFIKRRNAIVSECLVFRKSLSIDEELSLSGVVLLDESISSCMIEEDYYYEACSQLKQDYKKYQANNEEEFSSELMTFAKLLFNGDFNDADNFVNTATIPSDIKQVLFSLLRTYRLGYASQEMNESTMVKDSIISFFEPFFANSKKFRTHGADKKRNERGIRFAEMDPSLKTHFKKADYSIVSSQGNHLVLALESKSIKSKDQSTGDLIKMAKYMKDTIDAIDSDGFESLNIIGIIASGSSVSVYMMKHEYDYIYTLLKTHTFHVPVDCYDMYRIISIIPTISFIKNVVVESTNELAKLPHNRVYRDSFKNVSTYHTPTQIPSSRIKRVNLAPEHVGNARRKLRFN